MRCRGKIYLYKDTRSLVEIIHIVYKMTEKLTGKSTLYITVMLNS